MAGDDILGDSYPIEMWVDGEKRGVYRVSTDRRRPRPVPLSRLTDHVIDRLGNSRSNGIAAAVIFFGLTAVLLWVGGLFDGFTPEFGVYVGIAIVGAIATLVATFRMTTVVSNRDRAVYVTLGCLGLSHARKTALDGFEAVTLRYTIESPSERSADRRASQGPRKSTVKFDVLLVGEETFNLQHFYDAFEAREQAQLLAEYFNLPLVLPEVDDLAALEEVDAVV